MKTIKGLALAALCGGVFLTSVALAASAPAIAICIIILSFSYLVGSLD